MTENVIAISGYTVKQHLRHKVYLSVLIFGLVLVTGALVISSLSTGRVRMLMNLGLAGIEFLALLTVIFTTVNLVLEEVESRTVYLMLTHPLERWEYLLGRYIGTVISIMFAMLLMMVLHVGLLVLAGWKPGLFYLAAWLGSAGKVLVVSAVALVFSLFSTSAVSSMSFTVLLWILGHFSEELRFLGQKSVNVLVKALVWAVYHVTPNFSYYNYRDFGDAISTPPASWFGWMGIYTLAYLAVCMVLANFLFSQKEF